MNEPIRTQWQIRCAFNGFCKLALRREAMNAHRDTKQRFATNILQMMKRNSLSLSAVKRLLQSCLPKPCTVYRKKSGKSYCCITSLI